MKKVLWQIQWGRNRLCLVNESGQACLNAYKDNRFLHQWCVDDCFAQKISIAINSLLTNTNISYAYPEDGETIGMYLEQIFKQVFIFEFCIGVNIDKQVNRILFVTNTKHIKKLEQLLSQASV